MTRTTKAATIIRNFLFENFSVDFTKTIKLSNTFEELTKIKISPKTCGPVAMMFETLEAQIMVGLGPKNTENENKVYIQVNFSYTHPNGGSNGRTCQHVLEIPQD